MSHLPEVTHGLASWDHRHGEGDNYHSHPPKTTNPPLIRELEDMVDTDDYYRQPQTVWKPCERCSGRLRVVGADLVGVDVMVQCEDCAQEYIVEDRGGPS